MKTLTDADIEQVAKSLDLEVAVVKAVRQVEVGGKSGFDATGLPIILFEGHWFSHFTNGVYDKSHPTISYPTWTKRFYTGSNTREHARLAEAAQLDREAALKSASWGLAQIMGFNYEAAGFKKLQDFVNAMYESEQAQLLAWMNFIKTDKHGRMVPALRQHRWADFARDYNGSDYAKNKYDTKLAEAYMDFS